MRLYIIRHGQSVSNDKQNHQGNNSELSALGKKQAKIVASRAARLPFEVIISSDSARSLQTVKIIQKRKRKKLVITPLLREETHPAELEEKHVSDPDVIRIKKLLVKNRNNKNWHFSNEENFFDLKKRVEKLLRFLEKRPEKNILVIGHTFTTRMLIGVMLLGKHLTPDIFYKMRKQMLLRNTGITMCDLIDGEWKLVTWNDHEHLG